MWRQEYEALPQMSSPVSAVAVLDLQVNPAGYRSCDRGYCSRSGRLRGQVGGQVPVADNQSVAGGREDSSTFSLRAPSDTDQSWRIDSGRVQPVSQ